MSDIEKAIAFTTGYVWAEACDRVFKGEDITKVEMPAVLEAVKNAYRNSGGDVLA